MKDFVAQYCNLILYALRDSQPVKADECVCDVVGAFQIEYRVVAISPLPVPQRHNYFENVKSVTEISPIPVTQPDI